MPYRLSLLLSLIVVAPLGYVIRFAGAMPEWLNDALGSVFYEIFWILLIVWVYPQVLPLKAAIGVCLATCGLEFLQLWQPQWLQALRATVPGRLVLGNTFTWSDFPAYFVGSFAGCLWVRSLHQTLKTRRKVSN